MRQSAGDDGVGRAAPRGNADALVIEEGAFAALGDEQVVIGRIVGQAGDDRAVPLKRDRNGEMRDAVQEIGGAIERIDDPAVAPIGAGVRAAFLAEEAIVGPRLGEFLAHDLLGAAVGGGDEIARALDRHLQLLDLAEVALEASPGAMRRLDHDVENGGMQHAIAVGGGVQCRQARRGASAQGCGAYYRFPCEGGVSRALLSCCPAKRGRGPREGCKAVGRIRSHLCCTSPP